MQGGDRINRDRMPDQTRRRQPRQHGDNHRSRGSRTGGRYGRQQSFSHRFADEPTERGRIGSLLESFGFIYCADRPQEMFFHITSYDGPWGDLSVGDEVEFVPRPSTGGGRSGGRSSSMGSSQGDKMAAYGVRVLEPGTVVWEDVDTPGVLTRGRVERPAEGGSMRGRGPSEGTIRVLADDEEQEEEEEEEAGNGDATDRGNAKQRQESPPALVRYTVSDYQPDNSGDSTSNYSEQDSRRSSYQTKLYPGDVCDFVLVTSRRDKMKYARSITLVLSERERLAIEKEKKLMESATQEQGVVVGLKHQFGFIRSNKRREEVYFHFSNIELPDDDNEGEFTLAEGQELSFLVVDERKLDDMPGGEGTSSNKISARQVNFLPKGSVKFHHVIASGVTGKVGVRPLPPPGPSSSYSSRGGSRQSSRASASNSLQAGTVGRVVLDKPITLTNEEAKKFVITEVDFPPELSPGGYFETSRDGSRPRLGVWAHEGDTLLFDVVVDSVDRRCRIEPTKFLKPAQTTCDDPGVAELDPEANEATIGEPAVRLIAPALAGRAEGIVHVVKDNYGFIFLAERNAEVYFRLYDIFPPDVNADLVRNLTPTSGKSCTEDTAGVSIPKTIAPGTEVSFDVFLQDGGRQQMKENAKAMRLAILPNGSIMQQKVLASCARGKVTKEDPKQRFAGAIELEEPIVKMSDEERHPLAAKLLDCIDTDPNDEASILFPHSLPVSENKMFEKMIGGHQGRLVLEYVTREGQDDRIPGRLRISKAKEEVEGTTKKDTSVVDIVEKSGDMHENRSDAAESGEGTEGQRRFASVERPKSLKKTPKDLVKVRYDKHSLLKNGRNEVLDPPRLDDVVTCDVIQSRRSGAIAALNVKVVEHKQIERDTSKDGTDGSSCNGIVAELLETRQFGFISVVERKERGEVFFFYLSDVKKGEDSDKPICKGDEVKFEISSDPSTGKRVAKNVNILPRGTLGIKMEAKTNLRMGYILVEPSHTSLANTPSRKPDNGTPTKDATASRWSNVDTEKNVKNSASTVDHGRILLIEDPGSSGDTVPVEVSSYVTYTLDFRAGGSATKTRDGAPRRGDLVSFLTNKGKNGESARGIQVIERHAATVVKGQISDVSVDKEEATVVASGGGGEGYSFKFCEVVSCSPLLLKVGENVEGVLHNNKVYGVCRTKDLYLSSKVSGSGGAPSQRPKLNLTVRKELKGLGGQIMAQSGMAKGPDGTTCGFATGWTKRISPYQADEPNEKETQDGAGVDPSEESGGMNFEAEAFVPTGMQGAEES